MRRGGHPKTVLEMLLTGRSQRLGGAVDGAGEDDHLLGWARALSLASMASLTPGMTTAA